MAVKRFLDFRTLHEVQVFHFFKLRPATKPNDKAWFSMLVEVVKYALTKTFKASLKINKKHLHANCGKVLRVVSN